MKLLFIFGIFLTYLSLALPADFKHFPVKSGRPDSQRASGRGASAPARPPGNRNNVKESPRGGISAGEIVQNAVRSDNSRVQEKPRVNRNRSRGRGRKRITEQAVEKQTPVRSRPRSRPTSSRQETAVKEKRPNNNRLTFERTNKPPVRDRVAPIDFTERPVKQQSFNQVSNTQATVTSQQTQLQIDERPSQTFSQSLNEIFQPKILAKPARFEEAEIASQNRVRFQNRPPPVEKVQETLEEEPDQQLQFIDSIDPQSIHLEPFEQQFQQPLRVFSKPDPARVRPVEQQSFQPAPVQQRSQARPSLPASPAPQPRQPLLQFNPSAVQQPVQQQSFQQRPTPPPQQFRVTAQNQPQARPSVPASPAQQPRQPLLQFNPSAVQEPVQQQSFQQRPTPPPQQFRVTAQNQPQFVPQPVRPANSPPAPTFQAKPSLFSTPIEVPPQPDEPGASFSYEAFVG